MPQLDGITKLPLRRFLLIDIAAVLFTVGTFVSFGYADEKWLVPVKSLASGFSDAIPMIFHQIVIMT